MKQCKVPVQDCFASLHSETNQPTSAVSTLICICFSKLPFISLSNWTIAPVNSRLSKCEYPEFQIHSRPTDSIRLIIQIIRGRILHASTSQKKKKKKKKKNKQKNKKKKNKKKTKKKKKNKSQRHVSFFSSFYCSELLLLIWPTFVLTVW